MDLYYFRGSPWSLRVAWAMAALPERILNNTTLHNTAKADSMKAQVAKAKPYNPEEDAKREKVSVPMLFFTNEEGETVAIREGVEIISYLCESLSEEELEQCPFAQTFLASKESMKKWHEDSAMIMRYIRAKASDAGDKIVQYYVPTFVLWIPFLVSTVSKKVAKNLRNKYYDIGMASSVEDMERVLQEAEDTLGDSAYLAGEHFSYADVSLCSMLEFCFPFKIDPPLSNGAIMPNTVGEMLKLGWPEKFPKVMAHREKVFETNFSPLAEKVTKMKLYKKPQVDTKAIWRK